MTALHTVLTIIHVLLAVAMVAIVTLQSAKARVCLCHRWRRPTAHGQNKSKALDAKLAGATKWMALRSWS